ncbi:hypothetical protein [Amycolatopsis sp. CA-230715]|uniref:hypothetical protein n=1 Tax=Amycolatopsis sp. CA-230715 TaxID=2745196 RepID=UPI001C038B93|nr:hypothetical protein [Amycolatopsis sp. CA-230715]QWF80319.1 hypothetical protein HUW46_03739 [Amycolatopsis sp. CA-230715]
MTTEALLRPQSPTRAPIATARIVACYATLFGALPYLVLKVSWLTGGTIGLRDASFLDSTVMTVGNAFTAGMDAVAILLAFAFTYSWGKRLPAPLVLFPSWVGTGFLAPIALGIPFFVPDLAAPGADLPLRGWVWAVVYGGFAWQGIALLTAFTLYAKERWGHLLDGVRVPVSAGAVVAIGTGVVHVAWALGARFWGGDAASLSQAAMNAVRGLLALAAVVAVVLARGWTAAVLVWTAAAAMFSWAFWDLFVTIGTRAQVSVPHLIFAVVQLLGGAALAVTLVRAVPRRT